MTVAPPENADTKILELEQRIKALELACDHLRLAVRRTTEIAVQVGQLQNVTDQMRADLIFREMKLAIAEINSWAPIDRPLFSVKKADE